MEQMLSVTEYAEMYGKDPGNIRRYISSGRMAGYKIGNQWIIPKDAAYPNDRREKNGKYRNWRKRVNLRSKSELMDILKRMLRDLRILYGRSLRSVVIYGSYARGTETEESDVDIALMLTTKPDKEKTDAMIDIAASYELEYGKVLSVIEISATQFDKWKEVLPFYMNIEKEGIPVWKAT